MSLFKVFGLSLFLYSSNAQCAELTELSNLVQLGDTSAVENYLSANPRTDLNKIDDDECPPLVFSITSTDLGGPSSINWAMVNLLIKNGAKLTTQCGPKISYHGAYAFLDAFYDPYASDLLSVAFMYPQFKVSDIQKLLQLGAVLTETQTNSRPGSNLWASLLSKGPYSKYTDGSNHDYQNDLSTLAKADFLIQNKIDPNQLSVAGCPGFYATTIASSSMLQKLLQAKANFSIKCSQSPLSGITSEWASMPHPEFLNLVQSMITKGASIDFQDSNGNSIFWNTVGTKSSDNLDLLRYYVSLKPNLKLNYLKQSGLSTLPFVIGCGYYTYDCATDSSVKEKTLFLIQSFLDLGERDFSAFLNYGTNWFQGARFFGTSTESFAIQIYQLFQKYGLKGDIYDKNKSTGDLTLRHSVLLESLADFPKLAQVMVNNGADLSQTISSDIGNVTPILKGLSDLNLFAMIRSWNVPQASYVQNLGGTLLSAEALKNLQSIGIDPGATTPDGFGQILRATTLNRNHYYGCGMIMQDDAFAAFDYVIKNTKLPLNQKLKDESVAYSGLLTTTLQSFLMTVIPNLNPLFCSNSQTYKQSLFNWLADLTSAGTLMDWGLLDSKGQNILFTAARMNSTDQDVFQYFLDKQVSPNVISNEGRSLFFSVENPQLVPLLISKGLDINLQDQNGDSALMIQAQACVYGNESNYAVTQALLANGANTDLKNKKNQTVFDLVRYYACPKTKALLGF